MVEAAQVLRQQSSLFFLFLHLRIKQFTWTPSLHQLSREICSINSHATLHNDSSNSTTCTLHEVAEYHHAVYDSWVVLSLSLSLSLSLYVGSNDVDRCYHTTQPWPQFSSSAAFESIWAKVLSGFMTQWAYGSRMLRARLRCLGLHYVSLMTSVFSMFFVLCCKCWMMLLPTCNQFVHSIDPCAIPPQPNSLPFSKVQPPSNPFHPCRSVQHIPSRIHPALTL